MKISSLVFLMLLTTFSVSSLSAQGLINGGFELYDPQTAFLEGWKIKEVRELRTIDHSTIRDGKVGSLVGYKSAEVSLPGPSMNGYADWDGPPELKEGNYFLHANGFSTGATVVVEQTFLVPEETSSLHFRGANTIYGFCFVHINGAEVRQQSEKIVVPGGPFGYVVDYWVDMTPYRGQAVSLEFLFPYESQIDRIRLNTEPVPEPGIWALLALGIGIFSLKYLRTGYRTV